MRAIKQSKNIILIILALLFIATWISTLPSGMYWDTAVYIGMGKHITSFGSEGLWEESRPLIWPTIVGISQRVVNHNLVPTILQLLFTLASAFLVFKIGTFIADQKTGLIASFLTLFSPTIIEFSSTGLSAIPATFFLLLTLYLFLKKQYFYAGIFAGVACMTRFLFLFGGIILGIFLLIDIYNKRKNAIRNTIHYAGGALLIILPYLLLNIFLYKDPFLPFTLQSYLTAVTGWQHFQPFTYYFPLLLIESFTVLFALVSLYFMYQKPRREYLAIAAITLFYIIFFSVITHKEPRFIITFLPFLYLLSALAITKLLKGKWSTVLLSIIIVLSIVQTSSQIQRGIHEELPFFHKYIANDNVQEGIWISSPHHMINSNKKADRLIYYPTFSEEHVNNLKQDLDQANHLLINTCDVECSPLIEDCQVHYDIFFEEVFERFPLVHQSSTKGCQLMIFSAP